MEEYKRNLLTHMRFQADAEGETPQDMFVTWAISKLEEYGEFQDPVLFSCNMRGERNRRLAFHAYAYSPADSSITLVISDFENSFDTENLTETRINELCSCMRNFIVEAVANTVKKHCDEYDSILDIAKEFRSKVGLNKFETEILTFKLYIVTNKNLSQRIKELEQEDLLERPVTLSVWAVDRFYQRDSSISAEAITINCEDFGIEDGIPCVEADIANHGDYRAYLGIVPGIFLAKIYRKYNGKLLEGNVRSFLNPRGKVNKKIRETIVSKELRHNFFIYNNGISVVANKVVFSADRHHITSFTDFQIINGGQTTASLANSYIKKESDLEEIFVPMKLTVLELEDQDSKESQDLYEEITQKISTCANSQNPVSGADFFSNHPFHKALEKIAGHAVAPAVDGGQNDTMWFYERLRNSWMQKQMDFTEAQKRSFIKKYPKKQVLTKERFAKGLNTVFLNPHNVSAGASSNMKSFAKIIDNIWEEKRDEINEYFFKKGVAATILFDTTDYIISHSDWYQSGGHKSSYTPYTISKIISCIPKGFDIDWEYIWKKQKLYPELVRQIEIAALFTSKYLDKRANGGIVRSFSVKSSCWDDFKKESMQLTDDFIKTLISKEAVKDVNKSLKKEAKSMIRAMGAVEIFNKGVDYWMDFYNDMIKYDLLTNRSDADFIKSIAQGFIAKYKLPTDRQVSRLEKIISEATEKGYLMKE